MGKYFRMSYHFNKLALGDYGLVKAEDDTYAICPVDDSRWVPCSLYDFGWGCENGFYRVPLLNCEELFQLVLESEDNDDLYGAAAILMEKYPDKLLEYCEEVFTAPVHEGKAKRVADIFQLQLCINRSSNFGKKYEEITNDSDRWYSLGKKARKLGHNSARRPCQRQR